MTGNKKQTTVVKKTAGLPAAKAQGKDYLVLCDDIARLLETARRASARAVNAIMTATYWEVGRRIVEYEQKGKTRAGYGEELLKRLSADLGKSFQRGFGVDNLQRFRSFYMMYPPEKIYATLSRKSSGESFVEKYATPSRTSMPSSLPVAAGFDFNAVAACFPLPWSAYVRLLSVKSDPARKFYEEEALRGGWSVRQLDRQINSQFYERTALSRNKAAMLKRGQKQEPSDVLTPEEEIKEPYILEFLGLKDEYSESDLEDALIQHLEHFLLELGGDFCFVGRQKRLRIGDDWYRVDLLFFHRRLRCLMVIDLKLGRFTHADAGQMHLYLNYAREHWMRDNENPPIGLILCAQKNDALARYTLDNLPNKVLAAEYRTTLPDEKLIATELEKTRRLIEERQKKRGAEKTEARR